MCMSVYVFVEMFGCSAVRLDSVDLNIYVNEWKMWILKMKKLLIHSDTGFLVLAWHILTTYPCHIFFDSIIKLEMTTRLRQKLVLGKYHSVFRVFEINNKLGSRLFA